MIILEATSKTEPPGAVQSKGIVLNHIQTGKPAQNAYVERFNKTYSTEVLCCFVFDSMQEVRDMTADWLELTHFGGRLMV
ncbi:MAG: integrase core domain-containing protein [Hydrogenophaga sp.]|uniref:integrase core domain-containing protein n=1 Tax=Hydrogenophaga sp. TaxID=1904254 RepID=UPI0026185D47|nr:integrase core domain-containing protein [Hydrogenophaga sp.]MDM7943807.1 integrase core domain-containing protein [Hydrogenophaga sp.]